MRRLAHALVFCTAFVSLAAAAFDKPAFPRLGGYKIGNPKAYETEALQADLAKLDVVIIGAGPGWEVAHRANLEDVIRAIKKRNPQIVIVNYLNVNDRVASRGWCMEGGNRHGREGKMVVVSAGHVGRSRGIHLARKSHHQLFARRADEQQG